MKKAKNKCALCGVVSNEIAELRDKNKKYAEALKAISRFPKLFVAINFVENRLMEIAAEALKDTIK